MLMDKETLVALKESIIKWHRNAIGKTREVSRFECPLCNLYFKDYRHRCIGCPIAKYTNDTNCIGTPYQDADEAYNDDDWDSFKRISKIEVKFLVSLLPIGESIKTSDGTIYTNNPTVNGYNGIY